MNSKIYIKDWLVMKPYDKQAATDSFYLGVCNDVKKAITSNSSLPMLEEHMSKKDINLLACFLTSYFEDVISGTNIWRTFVKLHSELYKKVLPFYPSANYSMDEINVKDIAFLIWYFVNTIQEEAIMAPFNDFIVEVTRDTIGIFNDEWEYAPENDYLKSFYEIDQHEEDFYIARKLIDTLLFKTYLFYPDSALKLKKQEKEIIEEHRNDEDILMYFNENRDSTVHNIHTKLLSLKGQEWAAEVLGKNHALSKDLLNISKRVVGLFFYKGQDENTIYIEHIASGKKFNLTKKSFDHSDSLNVVDTILFLGIARWKDEWWFSGINFQLPFDADVVLEEKNSLQSRGAVSFLDHHVKESDKLLQKQLSVFKKFNNGSQIAFMPSTHINKFIKEYTEVFNSSLNLSEQEIRDTRQRTRDDGLLGQQVLDTDYMQKSESGLVFFNPKSGVEVALGVNSAFPLSTNPFYNEAESEEHVMYLMIEESFSTELTMYCIDNFKDKLPFFKDGIGKLYLNDIDFLLRFWKKGNYHTVPSITYTDGNK